MDRFEVLREVSGIERPVLCVKILLALNLYDNGFVPDGVDCFKHGDSVFYNSVGIFECIEPEAKTRNNFNKAVNGLMAAGFLERLVIDVNGNVVTTNNFHRKTAKLYWCLTDKARLVLVS